MGEPVSFNFILATVGVILVLISVGIVLVNQKTKKKEK